MKSGKGYGGKGPVQGGNRGHSVYNNWYHTIDLPDGFVTPGAFDLRAYAAKILPRSLESLRCLDVGTFDGFWAFELEKRKAAKVYALDLESLDQVDWPPNEEQANRLDCENGAALGEGFRLASEALGSAVERVERNVFQLSVDDIGGEMVDFAFVGTMLQHVRDPIGALVKVRDVVKPGGKIILAETVSLNLTLLHPFRELADFRPGRRGSKWTWWVPNVAALKGYARTAGLQPSKGFPLLHRLSKQHDDRIVAIYCERI